MANRQQTGRIPRYYLESSCFVAFVKNEPGRGATVLRLLQDAEAGRIQLVTSFITLAEVLRGGADLASGEPFGDEELDHLLRKSQVELVAVERFVAEKTREVRRSVAKLEKKTMTIDAIHIATALVSEVDALYSYDDADLVIHDGHFEGLRVQHPTWSGQLTLPEA